MILVKIKKMIFSILKLKYSKKIKKTAASVGTNIHVNRKSFVTKNTYLGDNVNFNGMKIKGEGKVTIGNYFHSGEECLIITSFHNYDNGTEIPYDSTVINKDVEIGDFVWIGERVIILGGAKIGEGAVIQAGSVVVDEIPPFGIAGGHPAKVFKYRNIEHFNELKDKHMFH